MTKSWRRLVLLVIDVVAAIAAILLEELGTMVRSGRLQSDRVLQLIESAASTDSLLRVMGAGG